MTDAWLPAIRDRLERGPATSQELAEACGCEVRCLGPCLYELLEAGTLAIITTTPNQGGYPHSVWSLSK